MTIPYEPPEFAKNAFNCPHRECRAHANMTWVFKTSSLNTTATPEFCQRGGVASSHCARCQNHSIWIRGKLAYPASNTAPPPNPETPAEVLLLYNEAASLHHLSPRAAGGLLRLAVETLVNELESGSGSLNDKIGRLVEKGLHPKIQKALDAIRVIGNNAVHPGEINADDPTTVSALYGLLNLIVEEMIEKPKHVNAVFDALPESAKAAIEKRTERGTP